MVPKKRAYSVEVARFWREPEHNDRIRPESPLVREIQRQDEAENPHGSMVVI